MFHNDKKISWGIVIICIMAMIVLDCTRSGQIAGTITQSGNGIICGRVFDSSAVASGVRVMLLPAGYNPAKDTGYTAVDTTDSLGNYTFAKINSGYYTILSRHSVSGKSAVSPVIHVLDNKTDTLAADTLRLPGCVTVMLPSNVNIVNGYIYIPGTLAFVSLKNSSGFVTLNSVPAGVNLNLYYSSTISTGVSVFRYGIQVKPGDTVNVVNPGWSHARTINLNTSVSGANTDGNVTNFPVLIRLTSDNFDFSQAKNNGDDIRFTKPDNTFLSYEIERWDTIQKHAEIWVKLDTVFGNDSAQSITMYWGNSDALAQSGSAAVFNISAGFLGVWHLAENGDTVFDATGNAHNGRKYGTDIVDGIIGEAVKFNGQDSIVIPGLMGMPASLTLSAWVKVDTLSASGQEVVSIGNSALLRAEEPDSGAGAYVSYDTNCFIPVVSNKYYSKTGWHLMAFVFDNVSHQHSLYIDGSIIKSITDSRPIDYSRNGINTLIGVHGDGKKGYNSHAAIDEVNISSTVRSADWIKLCYMNQQASDSLVVFK